MLHLITPAISAAYTPMVLDRRVHQGQKICKITKSTDNRVSLTRGIDLMASERVTAARIERCSWLLLYGGENKSRLDFASRAQCFHFSRRAIGKFISAIQLCVLCCSCGRRQRCTIPAMMFDKRLESRSRILVGSD